MLNITFRNIILIISLSPMATLAAPQSKLEVGLVLSSLSVPHYLGSDQRENYLIPVPYFIYRGDRFKADRDGFRGQIFQDDHWELTFSLGGALPVNSSDNEAREGMENLDFIIEAGPNLRYTFFKDKEHRLFFNIPIRGAFTLGTPLFRHQGWVFSPELKYRRGIGEWNFTTSIGSDFTDQRYNNYIYSITDKDVTDTRPLYQSSGGYAGSYIQASMTRQYERWFGGVFMQHYNISGAAYDESPLVLQNHYTSAGLAIGYAFYKSKKTSKNNLD